MPTVLGGRCAVRAFRCKSKALSMRFLTPLRFVRNDGRGWAVSSVSLPGRGRVETPEMRRLK